MPANHDPRHRQQIIAAADTLEWYDFIVYGFLASVIATLFFPSESPGASLLAAMATFGVGFFMRPVGGILLGIYADRRGRKAAMQAIIILMTVATAIITFAPTWQSVGLLAPALIVLARMLQGFATGGEYASATAFLVECAPPHRKGLYGSWQLFGQCLAVLLGAGAGTLVLSQLSPDALESWGWRIPFALGLLIGPLGLWIRRHMKESDEFTAASHRTEARERGDLLSAVRGQRRELLIGMGLVITGTASFYVVQVNMPTFAHARLALPLEGVLAAQMAAVALMALIIPLAGALSDRIGRRPVLLVGMTLLLVLCWPLYAWLAAAPSVAHFLIVQLILCAVCGLFFGPCPTALVELFPAHNRSTSISLAYNLAVMLFGGFAPFTITWLSGVLHSAATPAFYLIVATLLSIGAGLAMRESAPAARSAFSPSPRSPGMAGKEPL
jgi:MHS family proline/betaine transporter-like MFS transporter